MSDSFYIYSNVSGLASFFPLFWACKGENSSLEIVSGWGKRTTWTLEGWWCWAESWSLIWAWPRLRTAGRSMAGLVSCSAENVPLWCSLPPSPTESRWDGNEGWRVRRQIPSLCVELAWNHPAVMHADLIPRLRVPTLDPYPASPLSPKEDEPSEG